MDALGETDAGDDDDDEDLNDDDDDDDDGDDYDCHCFRLCLEFAHAQRPNDHEICHSWACLLSILISMDGATMTPLSTTTINKTHTHYGDYHVNILPTTAITMEATLLSRSNLIWPPWPCSNKLTSTCSWVSHLLKQKQHHYRPSTTHTTACLPGWLAGWQWAALFHSNGFTLHCPLHFVGCCYKITACYPD
jgi:hypothetical protein